MTKRTFTKYPSNYVKADSDYRKRICVYYTGDTEVDSYLADAIIVDALSHYDVAVNFEYEDARCRNEGLSLCIITSKRPIAKAKLKSIIEEELDITVKDIVVEDF